MKKSTLLLSVLLMGATQATFAQEENSEPKFTIKPAGRILMDGALYASPDKNLFKDGVAIPDARLGASMQYGKWKAKIDVGFAYNKVGLKDLFIEYDFNPANLIRVGSFTHQYGLQSSTSSSMKPTMAEPVANAVFNDARQIGVMYERSDDKYLGTISAHVEPSATTVILTPTQYTQEGYGFRTRQVWRPFHKDGLNFQVGVSGAFGTPQRTGDDDENHNTFQFKSNYPTSVSQVTAIDANVDHAMNLWKFTPELLISYKRVALESQYYFQQVNRRDNLHHWNGQGAYVTCRVYTYPRPRDNRQGRVAGWGGVIA
ncbi:MAG: OprO/OprP family phosphate-selective porin, partial [Muribaculaceae bacterium]|nr:OprO/OprP family phosphate-selective porin [Muribaculaceae bacterium]